MGENNQSDQCAVQVYDIMGTSPSRCAYNVADVSSDVRRLEPERISIDTRRMHVRNSRVRRAQSSRRLRHSGMSDKTRNRIANGSCLFGILGTAAGGGLIIMFVIAEYSQSLRQLTDFQAFVVPGFILLFLGIFGLVVGIYFCWVFQRRAQQLSRAEELAAGFHQHRRRGGNHAYSNPALVPDNPPSYIDLEGGQTNPYPIPLVQEPSVKLPSYGDAVTFNLQNKSESQNENSTEPPPPPYSCDLSSS